VISVAYLRLVSRQSTTPDVHRGLPFATLLSFVLPVFSLVANFFYSSLQPSPRLQ
jgi:hypothetical protein